MHIVFLCVAIIREIYSNGERLMELLSTAAGESSLLGSQFFKEALRAAIEMDSDVNVGYLTLSTQFNIPKYVDLAQREGKPRARTLLMLVMAAQTGDMEVLNQLDLKEEDRESSGGEKKTPQVHSLQLQVSVSPIAPIETAHRSGHFQLRDELTIRTNVYPEEKSVHWSGLQLKEVNVSLMSRISWVEQLKLDRNRLTVLPVEIGQYLQQVMHIYHKTGKIWRGF